MTLALTVVLQSRITSYVLARQPIERFLTANDISGGDIADARAYWTAMEQARDSLKPGEFLHVASDW